ncbi:MAG: YicC family protein, partial [Rhodospirillaceae bacterium]|nr:YicC family protein [Rhodospirillaceae bacterium]
WEARSVNGKGTDVRLRLPGGFEALEQPVRERAKKAVRRGNVSLSLTLSRTGSTDSVRLNDDVFNAVTDLLPELAARVPDAAPASLDGLLALRGVLESVDEGLSEEQMEQMHPALMADLEVALLALGDMRAEEGARLTVVLEEQINSIGALTNEALSLAAMQPDAIAKRLKEQVDALLKDIPALPTERLAQEAALLMTKADVSEELDRLAAHVSAVRDLMVADAAIGRKLDFLCQEFNREANTLCSKSTDVELTRVGLELKVVIEQFREQVQNIE